MTMVAPETVIAAMRWRYATKVFDPTTTISATDWQALEATLMLSPSSYGLQPWKFLVITDPAMRQRLLPHSWNQRQVVDSSHFVVFAGRTDITAADVNTLIDAIARIQQRDAAALQAYRGMMMGDLVNGPRHAMIGEWVARQVYIALGGFMTAAALLGIDTCPMEGIDPARYDETLGLQSSGYATKVACAAGYRAASDKYAALPKVRYAPEAVIQRVGAAAPAGT